MVPDKTSVYQFKAEEVQAILMAHLSVHDEINDIDEVDDMVAACDGGPWQKLELIQIKIDNGDVA